MVSRPTFSPRCGLGRAGQREDEDGGGQHEGASRPVGDFPRQAVEKSARDGPDDGCGLPRRGIPRHRVGEVLGRHEIGHQRGRGGSEEGAGHAEDGEDREDRSRSRQAHDGDSKEHERAGAFERGRQPHDQPAAEAVRHRASDEHQQQRGRELDDADEAEVERAARQVIDLPADGDGDDLRGKGRQEPRGPEEQEGPVPECGETIVLDGARIHCGPSGREGGCRAMRAINTGSSVSMRLGPASGPRQTRDCRKGQASDRTSSRRSRST